MNVQVYNGFTALTLYFDLSYLQCMQSEYVSKHLRLNQKKYIMVFSDANKYGETHYKLCIEND